MNASSVLEKDLLKTAFQKKDMEQNVAIGRFLAREIPNKIENPQGFGY